MEVWSLFLPGFTPADFDSLLYISRLISIVISLSIKKHFKTNLTVFFPQISLSLTWNWLLDSPFFTADAKKMTILKCV